MKKFLLSLLIAFAAITANAQTEWKAPYFWVGAQGGLGWVQNPVNFKLKDNLPTASLAVGYMMTPEVGARIHGNVMWDKTDVTYNHKNLGKYSYRYYTVDLDLMTNLVTIISGKDYSPFNVYLIAGVGYNKLDESMGDLEQIADESARNAIRAPKNIHNDVNIRGGVQLEYNIAKHLSATLEGDMNFDRTVTAQLGLNYKFGYKDGVKKSKKQEAPVTTTTQYDEELAKQEAARLAAAEAEKAKAAALARKAAEEAAATAAAAAKKVPEKLEKNVFFTIGKSAVATKTQADVVNEAAAWLKSHESATAVVTGYADKGTGTAAINKAVSARRATEVANKLKAKGIAADRISIKSVGDTVQPFADNDSNRVAIIVATEK